MQPPSARAPLHLISNQPTTRLHSQLDFGGHGADAKHRGGEIARMHPPDAASRGIGDGDIIRLFNERGCCLGAVRVTEDIRPGVVQLPTGAWYDPEDPREDAPLCVHGNPNVLTRDIGTSALARAAPVRSRRWKSRVSLVIFRLSKPTIRFELLKRQI